MKMLSVLTSILTLTLLTSSAWAQSDVGQVEFKAIVMLFSSPIGLALGLLTTAFGIWSFFVSQKHLRGIILLVLGVLISMFPSFYDMIRKDLYPAAKNLGGSGEGADFSKYVQ